MEVILHPAYFGSIAIISKWSKPQTYGLKSMTITKNKRTETV